MIPNEAANLSDQAIILACVDQVEHEGAHLLSHTDRSATFATSLISWGSNWRFTVPISAGSLAIDKDSAGRRKLSYDLSTRRTALIGTIMVIALFGVAAGKGAGQFPLWVPLVGWLWLVGANYLISFLRAPSWVSRRVSDALRASAGSASAARQPNERQS